MLLIYFHLILSRDYFNPHHTGTMQSQQYTSLHGFVLTGDAAAFTIVPTLNSHD